MKNLANCKPSEFLVQTNKIRKSVAKWLTDTDIINIRKRMPNVSDNVSDDERKEMLDKQAKANINAILDAILEEHPEETLELLALLCFVEPDHVDDYPMSEYIGVINEFLNSKEVIGFFTSSVQWGSRTTSITAEV